MAYNRNHARRLLTANEMSLFESSLKDRIGDLSRTDLRKKIDRARKARDKYTDLYRRQSLAARDRTGSKRGASGAANERTQQKATMFAEVLTRLDDQLAKIERAEARETKKTALDRARKGGTGRTTPKQAATKATKKAPAKAKKAGASPGGPNRFQDEGAGAARSRAKIASPRNKKISAHVGAAGKRSQAKRDSR
jgi:hypothetical protein